MAADSISISIPDGSQALSMDQFQSQYQIVDRAYAEGSYAVIYRAINLLKNEVVALKIIAANRYLDLNESEFKNIQSLDEFHSYTDAFPIVLNFFFIDESFYDI